VVGDIALVGGYAPPPLVAYPGRMPGMGDPQREQGVALR
jgi:hypothetical protein